VTELSPGLERLRSVLLDEVALDEEFDNGRFIRKNRDGHICLGRYRRRRGDWCRDAPRPTVPTSLILLYAFCVKPFGVRISCCEWARLKPWGVRVFDWVGDRRHRRIG